MYIFGHISVKQRQLPDQQVDSGLWVVQLCKNNSGLNSPSAWHLTNSHHIASTHFPSNFSHFGHHFVSISAAILFSLVRYNKNMLMQVWKGYIMALVIYQWIFMANISFFHKFDNLAAILNILANFSQTQPEMHVYLNFYIHTHHKD